MKLNWQTDTRKNTYTTNGESYSYQLRFDIHGNVWEICKLRQPRGQVVHRSYALGLEGAMARAQTWENDG